jgi:hypothetical protein
MRGILKSDSLTRGQGSKVPSGMIETSVGGYVTEVVAPDWPSFVRKSALAPTPSWRLSDTEFDHGMAALRVHGANINPAEAVTEEIDWFVFTKRA